MTAEIFQKFWDNTLWAESTGEQMLDWEKIEYAEWSHKDGPKAETRYYGTRVQGGEEEVTGLHKLVGIVRKVTSGQLHENTHNIQGDKNGLWRLIRNKRPTSPISDSTAIVQYLDAVATSSESASFKIAWDLTESDRYDPEA